jgi:hypothetical protein
VHDLWVKGCTYLELEGLHDVAYSCVYLYVYTYVYAYMHIYIYIYVYVYVYGYDNTWKKVLQKEAQSTCKDTSSILFSYDGTGRRLRRQQCDIKAY